MDFWGGGAGDCMPVGLEAVSPLRAAETASLPLLLPSGKTQERSEGGA